MGDRIAQLAYPSSKVASKHRPNSSAFNHKSGKSHQGMDRHTLGLGHINCYRVFSSAEIKGHKTQLGINVLLPCEPLTSKDLAGQLPTRRALVAQNIAAASHENVVCNTCAKICEQPSRDVKGVLWKGKCHFHFGKAAGVWSDFHDNNNNNNNKLFGCAKPGNKAEQLPAARRYPTLSQTTALAFPPGLPLPQPLPAPEHSQQICSRKMLGTPEPGEAWAG